MRFVRAVLDGAIIALISYLLAFLLWAILAAVACPASADPVTVMWENTAGPEYPNATQALLCAGTSCSMANTDCAPGARCETTHDLPPGDYELVYLMVAAPGGGWLWSRAMPWSLTVEPAEPSSACRADFDGNGVVTTVDVSVAIGEFWGGCGEN